MFVEVIVVGDGVCGVTPFHSALDRIQPVPLRLWDVQSMCTLISMVHMTYCIPTLSPPHSYIRHR